jgi:hypothetical protein
MPLAKGRALHLENGALAKTLGTIITHVEANLEETLHSPLPGAPNVRGFYVARTWGTTRRTQRFECRGLYACDLDRNETWRQKPQDAGEHNAPQRETPSFTQVQGAIPREGYKALVIEL